MIRENGENVVLLAHSIAQGVQARLALRGVVTQEAITKLIAMLALSRDTFPHQSDQSGAPEGRSGSEEGA